MKRLLSGMLLWGVAWGAPPFPHSAHLKMGLECVSCHTAAASSTKVEDLLPSTQVCRECHDAAEIPTFHAVRPAVPLAKFSHALHLKMGNVAPFIAASIDHKQYFGAPGAGTAWVRGRLNTGNACEACHRGLEESDRVTAAALPQMADCLVCHTVIEAPFSCEDCHAKDAALQPASHTEIPHFLDAHSSGKLNLDKTACAICHGRTFTCMGCH